MKTLRTTLMTLAVAGILLIVSAAGVSGQVSDPFTHPHNPHLELTCPSIDCADVPMIVPGLFESYRDTVITLPVLTVLMEFSDITHRPEHTLAFWEDLVYGNPRAGVRPSVCEIYQENSNGRFLLVPATAGDIYDGTADGIVGWVASSQTAAALFDASVKRAEGIRVADPLFDYWRYDTDNDGRITSNELAILVVLADNADSAASCDMHHPEWGHVDPPFCVGRPGGNVRETNPMRVDVDQYSSWPKQVHQWIAGVGEMAHVGVTSHELAHSTLGLSDLYQRDQNSQNCVFWERLPDGYWCDSTVWYPPPPNTYSLMSAYNNDWITHLDPWAKMHLGFTRYKWIDHDGAYTLYDIETERNFSLQETEPELFLLYDPLKPAPFNEYFLLEVRFPPIAFDAGLTVWLINEETSNYRKVVRLIRRDGHWVDDRYVCWDGTHDTLGYDLTPFSTPRNTDWTDSTHSYIEITDISPVGSSMTVNIRVVPVFVDRDYVGLEYGSQWQPFNTVMEAVSYIPVPPRTIMVAGGNYPGAHEINRPCTITTWDGGEVVIGE